MRRRLIALLFLVLPTLARAQQLASVSVTVTDSAGKALPGARVAMVSQSTGLARTQTADRWGVAAIAALAAGEYRLTVTAGGFRIYQTFLSVTVGQSASVTAALGIATVQQSVTVGETGSVGIDTQKTESSQVIRPRQIADLPIADRDFIDFVLLTPTANVGRSTATAAQSPFQESVLELSFGGLRETHSVFFGLDGSDYTISLSGVQRTSPSLDWVQEFRVTDGPFGEDNGRNLGAVVSTITKSGTNDLHGTVYEYLRNSEADANSPLSAPGFNVLRFNQFGADAGGPISRDRTFFFGGDEGQRRAGSPTYSSFVLGCINTPGCMGP